MADELNDPAQLSQGWKNTHSASSIGIGWSLIDTFKAQFDTWNTKRAFTIALRM
jgi:hypothetical protein